MCLRDPIDKGDCKGHKCVVCDRLFFCYGDKHECPGGLRQTCGHELGEERGMSVHQRLLMATEMLHLIDEGME